MLIHHLQSCFQYQPSGNRYCQLCITDKVYGRADNYFCNTDTYANDTYSCEVGDLTGAKAAISVKSLITSMVMVTAVSYVPIECSFVLLWWISASEATCTQLTLFSILVRCYSFTLVLVRNYCAPSMGNQLVRYVSVNFLLRQTQTPPPPLVVYVLPGRLGALNVGKDSIVGPYKVTDQHMPTADLLDVCVCVYCEL